MYIDTISYLFITIMSVVLFLLTGKIGKLLSPFGYVSIYSFNEKEGEHGFNFLYRIAFPLVFIIILTYLLYFISLEQYVNNIWVIVPLSYLIRFIYIIVMNRLKLISYPYFLITFTTSTLISYYLYKHFLSNGELLFPDKDSIATEIWLLIILFIYKLSNTISNNDFSLAKNKRENKYILSKYSHFYNQYADIIEANTTNEVIKNLIFAVLIIENFNRPKVWRFFERAVGGKRTYGVMQVTGDSPISDRASVEIGAIKIKTDFIETAGELKTERKKFKNTYINRRVLLSRTIRKYNRCDDYIKMVLSVYDKLENYYEDKIQKNK